MTAGSKEASGIANAGVDKQDPLLTGIGLHALQDSFSHAGYGPKGGHALAGHKPDDPSTDVDKAMKMAKATYDLLAAYMQKNCNQKPKVKWEDIAPKIQREFALGADEQKLPYDKQVSARVGRWKGLIKDSLKKDADFSYEKQKDPWQSEFEKKAGMINPPGS